MAKKETHFCRLFLTGIIWSIVYLDTMDRIYFSAFRFRPLNLNDWGDRLGNFLNNRWIINTGADWGLLICMFLFLPLWIIGWVFVYRLHWGRLFKKHSVSKPVFSNPTKVSEMVRKGFEPTKLRVQTSALLSVPPTPTGAAEGMVNSPMPEPGAIPNIPSPPPPPKYDDEAEVQQMLSLTAGIRADFFPHVLLDGAYASFAMSTEKLAAVVRVINRPESTFAVDTEIDINESDWFYESGLISAPAKDIIAISQNLERNEPDSVATPVILLMGGQLLNIDETLAYFEKNNIMLLRLDTVEGDSIPLFTDFLNEYFGQRAEGE